MNTDRDRLDEAIDRIAARMTTLEDDTALAARIAAALPERRFGLTWILAGWAPRLAVLAMAAIAITLVLRTFYDGSTKVLRTERASAALSIVEPLSNKRRTLVEPPVIERRTFVELSLNRRGTTVAGDLADHERSLPPIEPIAGLAVDALTPSELALEPVLVPAPLMIADLPLSSDFPPH